MEAAENEAGVENHLQDILSESEFSGLPKQVAFKINVFIDKKFEEYLTSKALHETNKSQIGKPGVRDGDAVSILQFTNDANYILDHAVTIDGFLFNNLFFMYLK